jgi:glycosyltransferase involved in cell wall biosynthesis
VRIGVLTTSFPRHEGDIAGNFVLGFARALAERGHSLEVLAPEPCEPVAAPVYPGIETRFVPYLRPRALQRTFYGAGAPDNFARDPLALLGALPFPLALTRCAYSQAQGWDAVISHWALPSALVAGLVRHGRPHLAVLHSADVHLLSRLPLRKSFAQRIAEHATALWFVADPQRERFLSWLDGPPRMAAQTKCFVSPMGVDAPLPCDRAAARAALGLSGFTAITLGRLITIKGVDLAVEAAARSGVTLLVAGEGPERSRLQAQARARGADVRFLGLVTGADKARLLCAADALLMPSRVLPDGRHEGVPTAVLEAMAHGLPVIAAATGGIPDVVRDRDTGLLAAPEDAGAIAEALHALRGDPGLQERLRTRGKALSAQLQWPVLGQKAEELLGGRVPSLGPTRVSVA